MKRVFVATLAFILAGCGSDSFYQGPVSPVLPAHVRKIAVRPIVKRVEAPGHNTVGWEDKLRLRIQDELIRDGRFTFVTNEADADGVLFGEITRMIFEPLAHDAANVITETKLLVVLDIGFEDRVEKKVLWEEPRLEQDFAYFVSTQPGGLTEDEARDELWDRFARDVVKRTVEGFGSVTGASERKISSEPAGEKTPSPEAAPRRTPPPAPY